VPGSGPGHGWTIGSASIRGQIGFNSHRALPVVPVLVGDQKRNRPARREAAANASQGFRAIGLDCHPATSAVAALAAAQLGGDGREIDGKAGRDALENRDERLTVRLAGSEKSQHGRFILSEIIATSWRQRRVSRAIRKGDVLARSP